MLEKELYQEAEMEVIELEVQDVVTTSNTNNSVIFNGSIILPDDENWGN